MLKTGNARVIAYPYQDNIPNMDITAFVAKDNLAGSQFHPEKSQRIGLQMLLNFASL